MPRIAEDRVPAEPTSPHQKERYRRILRAAGSQGAAKGYDRVQMADIARDGGVAIATLYRYFPSKAHLFTAVMRARVQQLAGGSAGPPHRNTREDAPEDGIARLLVRAGRELMRYPLLAQAMLQSNNAIVAQTPGAGVTQTFTDLMLAAGGIEDPTDHDLRLLRLLEQAWYGILITALNGLIDLAEMDDDTKLICQLLLSGRDDGEPRETRPTLVGGSGRPAGAVLG